MKRRDFVKTMTAAGVGMALRPRAALAAGAQTAVPDSSVKRVLVMFKCHFDAGFVDTQYNVVHKRYFEKFFPEAIETARAANAGGKRRYVWTTGSWLLFEYLEQASAAERKTMEDAIARGDIAWHALPFTWQTEMLSPSMIEGSLALSQSLDRRFGTVTTGAKMTDVPGHTRGIIRAAGKTWRYVSRDRREWRLDARCAAADFFVEGSIRRESAHDVSPRIRRHCRGSGLRSGAGDGSARRQQRPSQARRDRPHSCGAGGAISECGDCGHQSERDGECSCALSRQAAGGDGRDWRHVDLRMRERPARKWRAIARFRGCARRGSQKARCRWATRRTCSCCATCCWSRSTPGAQIPRHGWTYDNLIPSDLASKLDTKNYKVVEFSWIEKRQDLLDGIATFPEALREEAQLAIRL